MIASLILPLYVSLLSLVFGYDEAEIVFAGDAMQHKAQLEAARTASGKYDYSQCFKDISGIIGCADYAVVNLETPVGPEPHSGYPCFNAPAEYVDALAEAGFDMFLTANNHTLDRGAKGLRLTIRELDARGLDHVGTYSNDSARATALPKVVKVGSFRVGFLNYTYGTNGIEPRDGVVVDYIDRERIKNDVQAVRNAGAELVAVCVHWGDEYKLLPNIAQRHLADFLEAIGVDMIIGGHPHVIQPMEFRKNRYHSEKEVALVYSLGNFLSNMKTPDTRGGAMLHVGLFRGEDGVARMKEASYSLVFSIAGNSASDNFKLLEAGSVQNPLWKSRADEFVRRARAIFDKHNIGVPERNR
ncbi:MAG: CapA family protein [Muribaculaceae bacterium]|nr:CapA family protein [Muribaculaceae bacterium]